MADTQNSERGFRFGSAPASDSEALALNCIPKRKAVGPKSAFRNGSTYRYLPGRKPWAAVAGKPGAPAAGAPR